MNKNDMNKNDMMQKDTDINKVKVSVTTSSYRMLHKHIEAAG